MNDPHALSLTGGGPLWRMARRPKKTQVKSLALGRVVFCAALAWLPQAGLALLAGHLGDHATQRLWATTYANHARLLLSIPMLLVVDAFVEARVRGAWRRFHDEFTAVANRPRLVALRDGVERLERSGAVEWLMVILAYGLVWFRFEHAPMSSSPWSGGSSGGHPGHLTLPGLWAAGVSFPMFYFLGMRWLWRYGLWVAFLVGVAGMPLRLVPAHADRAGGLGFVNEAQGSFALLPLAASVVIAGTWGDAILRHQASAMSYKEPVALLLFATLVVFVAPLAVFTPALRRFKLEALGRFDVFAGDLARAFQQKWLVTRSRESPLTAEVGALADVASAFAVTHAVGLAPIRAKLVRTYVVATLLPMLFPLLTRVPLFDLAQKLVEALA